MPLALVNLVLHPWRVLKPWSMAHSTSSPRRLIQWSPDALEKAEREADPDMASPTATQLPRRSTTGSPDEAIPDGDPSDTSAVLLERLQAWKHMCGYLEDYITEVAKDEKSSSKEKEKTLKSVSHPLREGHHFDQNLGGIAGLFENIRSNTQALANMHLETSKNLHSSVLPILERLHTEIKNKAKELSSGAVKGSKAVEKARNISQKYIELLGQYTAFFDSAGGHIDAANDPYVLQRLIYHRLNKQILEENAYHQDLLAVQLSVQQFEGHIIHTVQNALNTFNQYMGAQAERQKAIYGDIAATAQAIPPDFEWKGFIKRNEGILINPDAPSRSMTNVTFPNQNHRSTKPVIEGSLERKSRALGALKGYSPGYYAVTPSGYLHEFKDDDNFRKEPTPEVSLYLPECIIGAVDGVKFTVRGKDVSGGKIGSKLAYTSEFQFKAHNPGDAVRWRDVIASYTGSKNVTESLPTSPVESKDVSDEKPPGAIDTSVAQGEQTQGIVRGPGSEKMATPTSAAPASATSEKAAAPVAGSTPASATEKTPVATGQGSHFHSGPAENKLEERRYVHEQA